MIKAHCPKCGRTYLGETCSCRLRRKPAPLKCECGKPAKEIYVDDLGEWPMCADCLELALDEFACMPLPDYRLQDDPGIFDELVPIPSLGSSAPAQACIGAWPGARPFGLTEREYQVAALAHLDNQHIAERLVITESTVQDHIRKILKKLKLRSRYEIRHVLGRPPAAQPPEVGELPDALPQAGETRPESDLVTLTLTVSSRQASNIRRILESLLK
ncbi:MAG: hypothetical protein JXA78_06430 [Anaerolineales bacterium]|nr:hypothetical protein [Anaerolineales bacterium]